MRLYTWQTPDIELTEYTVDHGMSPWNDNFPKYPELCNTLSKQVGLESDRFIWCTTQRAKSWKGREEWELNVPANRVCLICSVTWNWILYRSNGETCNCCIPEKLFNLARPRGVSLLRDDFQTEFHAGWRVKTSWELWGMVRVNEIQEVACIDAVVSCPIEEDWIIKRPALQL